MVSDFSHSVMNTIPVVRGSNLLAPHTFHYAYKAFSIAKAASECRIDGDWVEFGVYKGDMARVMLDLLPTDSRLHLFDSFDGLERDWIPGFGKGAFKCDPPEFDDHRVEVVPGFFRDTARDHLSGKKIAFIHMDCDLYESTLEALYSIDVLRPGTIILFDEYVHDLNGVKVDDEMRAFDEWSRDTWTAWKYLWRTEWTQVAVQIV